MYLNTDVRGTPSLAEINSDSGQTGQNRVPILSIFKQITIFK